MTQESLDKINRYLAKQKISGIVIDMDMVRLDSDSGNEEYPRINDIYMPDYIEHKKVDVKQFNKGSVILPDWILDFDVELNELNYNIQNMDLLSSMLDLKWVCKSKYKIFPYMQRLSLDKIKEFESRYKSLLRTNDLDVIKMSDISYKISLVIKWMSFRKHTLLGEHKLTVQDNDFVRNCKYRCYIDKERLRYKIIPVKDSINVKKKACEILEMLVGCTGNFGEGICTPETSKYYENAFNAIAELSNMLNDERG